MGSPGDIPALKRHAAGTDDKNRQVPAVVRSGKWESGWVEVNVTIEPAGDGDHGDMTGPHPDPAGFPPANHRADYYMREGGFSSMPFPGFRESGVETGPLLAR